MIIVDWGNYEETLIILRIDDELEQRDFRKALVKIHQMVSMMPHNIDLMIDLRFSDTISAMMLQLLTRELEHRKPNLCRIIVISTPVQTRMLALAQGFYPKIFRDIQIVESVDHAYQYVDVSA